MDKYFTLRIKKMPPFFYVSIVMVIVQALLISNWVETSREAWGVMHGMALMVWIINVMYDLSRS